MYLRDSLQSKLKLLFKMPLISEKVSIWRGLRKNGRRESNVYILLASVYLAIQKPMTMLWSLQKIIIIMFTSLASQTFQFVHIRTEGSGHSCISFWCSWRML